MIPQVPFAFHHIASSSFGIAFHLRSVAAGNEPSRIFAPPSSSLNAQPAGRPEGLESQQFRIYRSSQGLPYKEFSRGFQGPIVGGVHSVPRDTFAGGLCCV